MGLKVSSHVMVKGRGRVVDYKSVEDAWLALVRMRVDVMSTEERVDEGVSQTVAVLDPASGRIGGREGVSGQREALSCKMDVFQVARVAEDTSGVSEVTKDSLARLVIWKCKTTAPETLLWP